MLRILPRIFSNLTSGPLRKSSFVHCDKNCVKLTSSPLTYWNSGQFLDFRSKSLLERVTFVGITHQYFGKKAGKQLEKKAVPKMKGNKGQASMHQTKIGQFFKRGPSEALESPKKNSPAAAPKKEVEDEKRIDSVDEDGHDVKNGKTEEKKVSGRKRRSKSTSSELSEEEETSKKAKKPEAKKQRRRIVIADSSSEEEEVKKPEREPKRASTGKKEVKEEKDEKAKKMSPKSDSKSNGTSTKKRKSEKGSPEPEPKSKSSKTKSTEEKKTRKSEDKSSSKEKEDKKSKMKDSSSKKDVDDKKSKTKESPSKKDVEEKEIKKEDNTSSKTPEKKANAAKDSKPVVAPPKGWDPDYNPAKNKYHPIDDASWSKDQRVPYLALAKTLEAIEATSSRLKNIEILSNYFRSVILLSPDDLLLSVYLCLNKLAPAYEGVELGVAETNVMKAIAQATGRSLDKIKHDAAEAGDLGIVAESSRSTQKTLFQPQPLTVYSVFHKLKEVAGMSGSSSHGKKISMITSLLVACKYSEARYLARSLLGKLRIGLAEQSLLQAVAQACFLTPPDQDRSEWPPKYLDRGKKLSAESIKAKCEEEAYKIKSAFCECPNFDILVKALLEEGTDGLNEKCKLTPGIPPRPMLAQPTKGVAEVLERFDGIKFTCEYKYDGERAQLHLLEDGSINIYSRNQENNTSKYPDIISRFKKCIKGEVKSCIIDTEAVAWDIEKQQILPFQVLSTRKRKDADEAEIKVQVCLFVFDLIYLNGESLIKEPLIKRRDLLRENFQAVTGEFVFATSLDTDSMEEVQEFLEESVKGNCEGLMVKTLDEKATYELAKRSQKWLKLKKDYLDCGGDSLDLVVIGGYTGKGRRTGTYGGFLLACYDPDEEVFQTICKLGTGFSDEQLQTHTDTLKPNVIQTPKSYYRFNTQMTPDHWFDATQVWEVKCADLSLSPVHTAAEGMADPQRGISLRFPRFIRIRDDKKIEDATSSSQVAEMYKSQEVVKNSTDKKTNDDDDFY